MANYSKHRSWLLGLVANLALAACGSPNAPSQATPPAAPRPASAVPSAPAVVEVARHYAELLAQGTALATLASRQYAGVSASSVADSSFSVVLPACQVQALLDGQQRLTTVAVVARRAPEDPNRRILASPTAPAHLVRLGELRQAFGAGAALPPPFDVLRHYQFIYRPTSTGSAVTIQAFMPTTTYADSAQAEQLVISKAPPQ